MKTLAVTAGLPAIVAIAAMVGIVTPPVSGEPRNVGPQPRAAGRAPRAAASGGSVASRVDVLFARWNRPDSPGCRLGVSRDGVTVYERGYGIASLESKAAITPATVFAVASISKSFTAMSVSTPSTNGAPATPPAVSLSAEQLARNEGLYRDPTNEALLRIFVREGRSRVARTSRCSPSSPTASPVRSSAS